LHEIRLYDDAFHVIDKAIELIPKFYRLYIRKIGWAITAGRKLNALELIEEYIDRIPYSKNILFHQKAFILSELERYNESLEIYDESLKLNPKDLIATNNKALLLAFLGRKKEAIDSAESLISLYPNNANVYDTYGEIYMMLGDYEEAINKFEKALEIESIGSWTFLTYLKLGFCYQELNLYNEAIEYFEKGKHLTGKMIPSERERNLPKIEKLLSKLKKSKNE